MWWGSNSEKKARQLASDLLDQVEKLSHRVNALELEFEALYDRVKSALMRISKRAEVVQKAEEQDHSEEPGLNAAAPDQNGAGFLTPRQKAIQQQVLRRRGGLTQ